MTKKKRLASLAGVPLLVLAARRVRRKRGLTEKDCEAIERVIETLDAAISKYYESLPAVPKSERALPLQLEKIDLANVSPEMASILDGILDGAPMFSLKDFRKA